MTTTTTNKQTNKQISKIQIQTLKDMKGEEVFFKGSCVGIDYPFISINGKLKTLNSSEWVSLLNEYWNSSENEGYWLKQEIKQEFKGI